MGRRIVLKVVDVVKWWMLFILWYILFVMASKLYDCPVARKQVMLFRATQSSVMGDPQIKSVDEVDFDTVQSQFLQATYWLSNLLAEVIIGFKNGCVLLYVLQNKFKRPCYFLVLHAYFSCQSMLS